MSRRDGITEATRLSALKLVAQPFKENELYKSPTVGTEFFPLDGALNWSVSTLLGTCETTSSPNFERASSTSHLEIVILCIRIRQLASSLGLDFPSSTS